MQSEKSQGHGRDGGDNSGREGRWVLCLEEDKKWKIRREKRGKNVQHTSRASHVMYVFNSQLI